MAHNGDNNGFDWNTLWTRLFAFVVLFSLAIGLYTIFASRQETVERRYSFCLSENESSRKQRVLWEGIILRSQANPVIGYVTVNGRKYTVTRPPPNKPQLEVFRKFINETYPIGKCVKGQLQPFMSPTPTPAP